MKQIFKIRIFILTLVVQILTGCSIKEAPPLSLYTLTSPKVESFSYSPYRNKVAKVSFPLSAKEPLTYKMAYTYGMREWGYYQNSQWANNIGKLIQGNLIQILQNSKIYRAVVPFQSSVPEDYRLESVVHDLYHYVGRDTSYAVVSIEFSLVDMRSGKLVKNRRFTYREPTPSIDAKGYVIAVNRAMGKLSRDILLWLR